VKYALEQKQHHYKTEQAAQLSPYHTRRDAAAEKHKKDQQQQGRQGDGRAYDQRGC
jgi:hypothetical protein